MKYTKEQLSGMSDFELSKAICLLVGYDVSGVTEQQNSMSGAVPEFLDDWECIMPLAVEHGVALAPNSDSWTAFTLQKNWQVVDMQYMDKSPQRAIACCLIMVLEEA
jgi:hypothetical protein